MKRFAMICLLVCCSLFASCNKGVSIENAKSKIVEYINDLDSYQISGTMEVVRNDNTVSFDVEVAYLAPDFYRVSFITQGSQNEQIIVKNSDGVFVLTPALNKEFKFESTWPLNSSHAYLLGSIVKDIVNDSETTCAIEDEMFVLKASISHKTNQNLTYMKFYCNKETLEPIKTVFYNSSDEPCIRVTFKTFKTDCNLDGSYFNVEKIMTEKTTSLGEGTVLEASGRMTSDYSVDGNSLVLNTNKEDTTIICYSGNKPYTIISTKINKDNPLTYVRLYDDFEFMKTGLLAIDANSITYFYLDQEITIVSSFLTIEEMINIAESIYWA